MSKDTSVHKIIYIEDVIMEQVLILGMIRQHLPELPPDFSVYNWQLPTKYLPKPKQ